MEEVVPPILKVDVAPAYPPQAREQGLQGSISLYLFISDSGKVKLARISDSSGYDILDKAAIQYAKRLLFYPARRGGKSTGIWLTWHVDYKLEPQQPCFVADKFFGELNHQMKLAEQASGRRRDRILQKILDYHRKYVRLLDADPGRNFNDFVRKLVAAEVNERWANLWNDWPMRFVVFHDFAVRYPNSNLVAFATERLLELIKQDILHIKQAAKKESNIRRKKDVLLRTIYEFLSDAYPHAIDEQMKPEAERYLQKKFHERI